jgi:hypothetical protein
MTVHAGCVNRRRNPPAMTGHRLKIFGSAWLQPTGIKQVLALRIEDRAILKDPKENKRAQ